jgi:Flp pilus assembly pilin Flp
MLATILRQFRRCPVAATSIEYALLAASIAAVIALSLHLLGETVVRLLQSALSIFS